MSLSLIAALIRRNVDKRFAALSFIACFKAARICVRKSIFDSHPHELISGWRLYPNRTNLATEQCNFKLLLLNDKTNAFTLDPTAPSL